MLTAALFVDAGYLFAAGSVSALGHLMPRSGVELVAPGGLIEHIMMGVRDRYEGPVRLLRTYWYDGARRGAADAAQEAIGALPQLR